MAWLECWGTYERSTAPYNVAMGGSPDNVLHGLDLGQAKAGDFGHGIRFTQQDTRVGVELSLVGYSITDQLRAIVNGKYVAGAFTYKWLIDWDYSTDGGHSWVGGQKGLLVADHNSNQNLAYGPNWHLSTVKWSGAVTLPDDFTHFRLTVYGQNPLEIRPNIYTREQIIRRYRAMATRKSGRFKSHNADTGFNRVRKSGSWQNSPDSEVSEHRQVDRGSQRIRDNGSWKQQGIIGE